MLKNIMSDPSKNYTVNTYPHIQKQYHDHVELILLFMGIDFADFTYSFGDSAIFSPEAFCLLLNYAESQSMVRPLVKDDLIKLTTYNSQYLMGNKYVCKDLELKVEKKGLKHLKIALAGSQNLFLECAAATFLDNRYHLNFEKFRGTIFNQDIYMQLQLSDGHVSQLSSKKKLIVNCKDLLTIGNSHEHKRN